MSRSFGKFLDFMKLSDSVYSDQMFRFRLYREKSAQHFTGLDYERVINGIYQSESKMMVSLTLKKRFSVNSFSEYAAVMQNISNSVSFADLIHHIAGIRNPAFRAVLKLIEKKRFRTLYAIRQIIGN